MNSFSVRFEDITLGADPEYAAGREINGVTEVVPAAFFRLKRGMVHVPDLKHPLYFDNGLIKVIEDGVAFELTIPPAPNGNWQQLMGSIYYGQDVITQLLAKYPDDTTGLVISPALPYDFEFWNNLGPEMMMSSIFGCDKDEDAFNPEYTSPTIDAEVYPWRFFGGHAHASGHPLFSISPRLSIKGFALGSGLAAVAFSPMPEEEKRRNSLYGMAGKFRPQHYPDGKGGVIDGVEFRKPSTMWTSPNFPEFTKEFFKWTKFSVEQLLNFPEKIMAFANELEDELIETVAQCDQERAKALLAYVESHV